MTKISKPLLAIVACAGLSLAGCELFDDGRIDLQITDAPIDDVDAVVVSISRVDLYAQDGERESFDFSPALSIDLMQLRNGDAFKLLDNENLRSGRYEQIRLRIDSAPDRFASYVQPRSGPRRALYVPDDASSGLGVPFDFEVDDNKRTRLTLDFDLRSSLRMPDDDEPDAYRLVPRLRAVEDRRSGTIVGNVSPTRIVSGCVPAVYVYSGHELDADDVGGSGARPLSSTIPFSDGSYIAAYLPAGDYTVAFTCDAGRDDPERNDAVDFSERETTVRAEQETRVDF